jgi:hypothetical protein
MIIVGNIISKEKLTGISNNFNQITEIPIENQIPTIIIGWELTKTLFPDTSILSKKIKENIYWTFSPIEKRSVFEDDLKKFIEKSYKDFVKDIKFYDIDPILFKVNNISEYLEKIKIVANGFAYLYVNKIVYVYNNFTVYSIDLELLDFIGFDREVVLSLLKESTTFFEVDLKKFKNELKYLDIRYIPYLECKNATKNTTPSHLPQG